MLGGVAIFLSTVLLYLVFAPKTFESITVITAASFLFFIGLVDDLVNIKPYQKLIGQLFGAVFVVGFGLKLPLTGFELIDIWITIFWIIGITNAINLLDNMDGLAGGISAIAAVSLGLSFWVNGQASETLVISIFVGSLLGSDSISIRRPFLWAIADRCSSDFCSRRRSCLIRWAGAREAS
jgi:UDP-GlcNAc:undecaprenyl-phosphate GlcNAc-1-phosphate transferase